MQANRPKRWRSTGKPRYLGSKRSCQSRN